MIRLAIVHTTLTALFLLFALDDALADTADAALRTQTLKIVSEELYEERTIHVRLPPGYDPLRSYPVVYVLDGEWNFEYVAGYLDYMADNELFPPALVAGIVNENRNRDYVPRADPDFPFTGGADKFLVFVEKEWIPRFEAQYAASGKRVLLGHSFGGVFTLHTLFTRPELFDAYIALGTSAWISDKVLFEEADELFDADAEPDAFVYMAVGENDGGPTVPSGKLLAEKFEAKAPDSLEWTFSITPRTEHFANFVSGTHEAFHSLFPGWGFDDEVRARAEADGAAGVEAWFSEKESELGWRFNPVWFDLGVTAVQMSREPELVPAALALTEALRRHHPENAFIALYSSTVFEYSGNLKQALVYIDSAISLAREQDLDPNELQISGLEEMRERIRQKMNAPTE